MELSLDIEDRVNSKFRGMSNS